MVKIINYIKKKILPIYIHFKSNELKMNVYNTNHDKKVLLVYLTSCFNKKIKYSHSNIWECKIASEIFSDLGYNVDVINYNATKMINAQSYDVVYGLGEAFEKLFRNKTKNQVFINYATGCNPIWSNIQTVKKVRDFSKKSKQILIESSRIIYHTQHQQILLSDKVVVLGNEFVLNTYLTYDDCASRYVNLNAFSFNFHKTNLENKDYNTTKKSFLWFGSSGALHKGLDLALDFFEKNPDYTLHICGFNAVSENRFFEYYKNEFSKTNNICNHGFVDITSPDFKNILDRCAYVLFPSVSEGGAVALLNVISNGGLLPIYSKSTGVDFEKYGIEFSEINEISLRESIVKSQEMVEDEYLKRSIDLQLLINEKYTIDNYRRNLSRIISDIVLR